MERLSVIRDGIEVAVMPLAGSSVEIGSSPENALCLPHPAVRPFHWVLRFRRGIWFAVPRGAPGGRTTPVSLARDGAVDAGPYRIRVVEDAAEDAPDESRHERTRPVAETLGRKSEGIVLRWIADGETRFRTVDTGSVTVGRSGRCDVVLRDPTVSERHARVSVEARGIFVEDLASLNGTFVDGRRIVVAEIPVGASIRLGAADLECLARRPVAGDVEARPRPLRTPGLRAAFDAVRRAAPLREPVLILGETGSGKEVIAHALHAEGSRAREPFVAVNCGALPRELAESMLFGHEKGAFTGAAESHRGAFQRADRGTLFLDEIGEAPPEIQAKLLRAIEEHEVMPLGAERSVAVDVRLVAATHRDLAEDVERGRFRRDLFHRLGVVVIRIPPLRDRPQDVGPLAEGILAALEPQVGRRRLSAGALRRLRGHPWPGNVRELRNVLVRAALECGDAEIPPEAIAPETYPAIESVRGDRESIDVVVRRHAGNITAAAREMGVPRSTLRDWLSGRVRRPRSTTR